MLTTFSMVYSTKSAIIGPMWTLLQELLFFRMALVEEWHFEFLVKNLPQLILGFDQKF